MAGKRNIIYSSSQEALVKFCVLMLTLGISIMASLYDNKSCYITIIVQAINNIYDFYRYTDNKKYDVFIKNESIAVVICAIVSIIISIIALLGLYNVMDTFCIRLLIILLVTIPLWVVYNDYKKNVDKENR